jgi:cyclopropane-fatty-acyl-phospholipid synthase
MSDDHTSLPPFAMQADRVSKFRFRRRFDEAVLRVCARLISPSAAGRLHLVLPSGACIVIAGSRPGSDAHLALKSYGVFRRALRGGSIGFAESWMAGEIESADLVALFAYFLDNKATLKRAGRGTFRVRSHDWTYHRSRANTRVGSRANIAAHYDLGNDFYRLWLDQTMTYSSAVFTPRGSSLEDAQEAKYEQVFAALALEPGHRLLEIGSGWGGFALRAARRGARVTGLTLSREQLAESQSLLGQNGFAGGSEIRFEDYRDVTGTFDRIASIEMIEAVGEENWPSYFAAIHDRLAPGGIAVLQAITIDEQIYPSYRAKADFIQRYIFPGGMLPTCDHMRVNAQAAGLEFEQVDRFGVSYARTLAAWRQRFNAAWPDIKALGFDERFRRMWDYYFAYCEAGFERGTVDVGIYRLRRRAATIAGE